ncbi:response regulator [Aquirufa nivalisilvae]|uniref:response regulator n=1 Tax=Aquirufa nivalisilvae TaxID=2516557 RepID=UPI001032B294|nr:response regulator transcription factor [Aquirufa nivalisilvae]TBH76309.1 response regulator transcription factor [Aquirufa nivalisilvae]
MSRYTVLIIDDEVAIQKLLKIALESQEYTVIQAFSGREGLALAASYLPDVILLDIGLPDLNGHEILAHLHDWYTKSIIMLSVQNAELDMVKALDMGAMDYLTKPFRTGELMARIRSAIRRNATDQMKSNWTFQDLNLDLTARLLKKNNQVIKLTQTEFNLLVLFAKNEGRVLTHQQILKEIWGVGSQLETQYLRVYVGTLRKKIEDNPNLPKHIITENGIGYRFQG